MNWWKADKRALAPEDEQGAGEPVETGGEPVETGGEAPPEPAAPDFSFIPEDFRKDGAVDADGFKAHLEDLSAAKGRLDEMLADVPEGADGYAFEIPEIDFEAYGLPKMEFEIQADDPVMGPLLKDLGGVMHQYGMPKGAAKDLMGVLARYEATSYKAAADRMQEDLKTLGSKSEARVAAVQRALEAKLPAELAKGLMDSVSSAAGVKALEKLLGGSGVSQTAIPPKDPVQSDLDNYYRNPT